MYTTKRPSAQPPRRWKAPARATLLLLAECSRSALRWLRWKTAASVQPFRGRVTSVSIFDFFPPNQHRRLSSSSRKRPTVFNHEWTRLTQHGEVAIALECVDLSTLSAGDLSPTNAGRRPARRGR